MRTCSDAGRGGSKDLPAVLGHDQQLHLLLGRRAVFLQDQELTVSMQEVVILDTCGAGWTGKKRVGRRDKVPRQGEGRKEQKREEKEE